MTVLLFKLALAGIRSRLLASALTIAIAAAAVATIVLALEVRSTGLDPWQRTFAEANGAHVLALVPSQADARPARVGDRRPARKYRSGAARRPEWPHGGEQTCTDRRFAAA
jgi:hypothetical protein